MSMSRSMREIASRMQYQAGVNENELLANSSSGYDEVSDEAKQSVDYERVSFNWPDGQIPQGNYFCLTSMAVDNLRNSGFEQEGMQLRRVLDLLDLKYSDLNDLLHHFLDFEPNMIPNADELALKEMAGKLGYDLGQLKKTKRENPLKHKSAKLSSEWNWLVENCKIKTIYGKDAAQELAPGAQEALSLKWLRELREGVALGNPDSEKVGDRAWFEESFPLGWINLDVFHDSALISSNLSFEQQMTVALWEEVSKTRRGWRVDDVRRLGFEHKNTVGISGHALMGSRAFEYLQTTLDPILNGQMKSAGSSGEVSKFLKWINPGQGDLEKEFCIWHVFRTIAPQVAQEVERAWGKLNKSNQGKMAQYEKLILSATLSGSFATPKINDSKERPDCEVEKDLKKRALARL